VLGGGSQDMVQLTGHGATVALSPRTKTVFDLHARPENDLCARLILHDHSLRMVWLGAILLIWRAAMLVKKKLWHPAIS
jgi:hypothetical protein